MLLNLCIVFIYFKILNNVKKYHPHELFCTINRTEKNISDTEANKGTAEALQPTENIRGAG